MPTVELVATPEEELKHLLAQVESAKAAAEAHLEHLKTVESDLIQKIHQSTLYPHMAASMVESLRKKAQADSAESQQADPAPEAKSESNRVPRRRNPSSPDVG